MSSYVPSVVSPVRAGSFDREIDRMFDEALRAFGVSGQAWAPACNAWEDSKPMIQAGSVTAPCIHRLLC